MKYLPVLLLILACEDVDEGGLDASALGCVQSDLVGQCPVGSNPLVGAQAEAVCAEAVGGVVQDGEGQATGQCYGVGSCRVVCQFAAPCRCGVQSVSRDGVMCADCQDAASCGNGTCEGGETPATCATDCGAVCNPGERRCDGERLEECSVQGRFESLLCPQGEACELVDGMARCTDDSSIIEGRDLGIGEDAAPLEDGRLIPGDGTWPVVVGVPGAAFPVDAVPVNRLVALEDGSIHNRPTAVAQAMEAVGDRFLRSWRSTEGGFEGLGGPGVVRLDEAGGLQTHPPAVFAPVDAGAFCEAYRECYPDASDEQCGVAFAAFGVGPDGAWRAACASAEARAGRCDIFLGLADPCRSTPIFAYPDTAQMTPNEVQVAGSVVLGVAPDRRHMVAIDFEAATAQVHDPLGDFHIDFSPESIAISADGRVAVAAATQGVDGVFVVWDRLAGTRRAFLPRSGAVVVHLALSPDGQVLAVHFQGGNDRLLDDSVTLWNLAEERRIVTIRPPTGDAPALRLLEFTADGRHLVFDVVNSTAVEVWRLGQVPEKVQVLALEDGIGQAAMAPDGRTLAIYSGRRTHLWNVEDGRRVRTLEALPGDLRTLRFSEGRLLVLLQDGFYQYTFRTLGP